MVAPSTRKIDKCLPGENANQNCVCIYACMLYVCLFVTVICISDTMWYCRIPLFDFELNLCT